MATQNSSGTNKLNRLFCLHPRKRQSPVPSKRPLTRSIEVNQLVTRLNLEVRLSVQDGKTNEIELTAVRTLLNRMPASKFRYSKGGVKRNTNFGLRIRIMKLLSLFHVITLATFALSIVTGNKETHNVLRLPLETEESETRPTASLIDPTDWFLQDLKRTSTLEHLEIVFVRCSKG
ncbi:hypothetical protein AHF37_11594 [Paragonimus kellicotti]|nr:hypothetical protein AHF37_11594 [Paragonimus kellicotti]